MNINRHNYEEFFLLYIDEELSSEERSAVEIFLQHNADLAAEMEMLQQARLQIEHFTFEQKDLLYNQQEGITLDNYKEFFLLSVDKELAEKESDEVEKFVLQHPQLQSEYLLLQRTKLDPEQITFEGKKQLLKPLVKERTLILYPWLRISAAAAVLGLACMMWIFNHTPDQRVQPVVAAPSPKELKKIPGKAVQAPAVSLNDAPVVRHTRPQVSNIPVAVLHVAKKESPKNRQFDVAVSPNDNKTIASAVPSVQPATTVGNSTIKARPADESIASNASRNKNNLPVVGEVERVATVAGNQDADYSSSIAKHVVYREIDSKDDEEERSFYIGSAEINKNKLKGFLKKAAGIFSKKQDPDGEHSLKIANFEIRSN